MNKIPRAFFAMMFGLLVYGALVHFNVPPERVGGCCKCRQVAPGNCKECLDAGQRRCPCQNGCGKQPCDCQKCDCCDCTKE